MDKIYKIGILGDGAWGTTLSILLSKKGYPVTLWGNFPEYLRILEEKRENIKYLPGVKIPQKIKIEKDINKVILNSDVVILAIPSKFLRSVLKKVNFQNKKQIFVSVIKGIEDRSLKTVSEIIKEEFGLINFAVLSGPTIANEVVREIPTVAVISSKNEKISKELQEIFFTEYFWVYRNNDVLGVELGGALKNIIAIAAGISDGLGFGANSKAAILTRGLAEIQRLGIKMGAKKRTFFGISGLGDLATTCMSFESRNRTFGERIGMGEKMEDILNEMLDINDKTKIRGIPEGVTAVRAVYKLSKNYNVSMPITNEVYDVLYKNKPPRVALKNLMLRSKKKE